MHILSQYWTKNTNYILRHPGEKTRFLVNCHPSCSSDCCNRGILGWKTQVASGWHVPWQKSVKLGFTLQGVEAGLEKDVLWLGITFCLFYSFCVLYFWSSVSLYSLGWPRTASPSCMLSICHYTQQEYLELLKYKVSVQWLGTLIFQSPYFLQFLNVERSVSIVKEPGLFSVWHWLANQPSVTDRLPVYVGVFVGWQSSIMVKTVDPRAQLSGFESHLYHL
jgi:hypothetical protein